MAAYSHFFPPYSLNRHLRVVPFWQFFRNFHKNELKNYEWCLSLDRIYKCDPCNFETKYSQNLEAHFKSLKHIANTDNPSKHTTIVHDEVESFDIPNGHVEEASYENEGKLYF